MTAFHKLENALVAKYEITMGRVPCLNQSDVFSSLDLSVLSIPVNTSASNGPPFCVILVTHVLWCFAMQSRKEQRETMIPKAF